MRRKQACSHFARQSRPSALNETVPSRAGDVILDETAVQDHVAIDEHYVVAARRSNGQIARSRKSKAQIVLPYVLNRQPRRPFLNDPPSGWAGTIVSDDHFCGRQGLSGDASQCQRQRIGPVIGRND